MESNTRPGADPSACAITLRGVVKHYGAVRAVDGVDLDIQRGEVFGLIGRNGAGKSTLFKMMLGLVRADTGTLLIQGSPVNERSFRSVRRGIGYLPENVVLYDNLSGLETMRYFARLKGVALSECEAVLDRVGLGTAAKRAVREYSKGMRQRLGFAQALLGSSRNSTRGEPTTGLDPEATRAFYQTLRQLRDDGVTMIITSHILAELQERVDRLAILSAGRIQALGSVQELREHMDLPLRLEVLSSAGGADAVQAALVSLPVQDLRRQDQRWHGNCPRDAKMAVLAAMAALNGAVRDVVVHEPSLEDVFFGFAD